MMMTSLCIPLLEKGEDPCIINNSSLAGRHGAPTATIHGAAKGAIGVFTKGSAKELAPKIRVNAVAPGVILTPFHDKGVLELRCLFLPLLFGFADIDRITPILQYSNTPALLWKYRQLSPRLSKKLSLFTFELVFRSIGRRRRCGRKSADLGI